MFTATVYGWTGTGRTIHAARRDAIRKIETAAAADAGPAAQRQREILIQACGAIYRDCVEVLEEREPLRMDLIHDIAHRLQRTAERIEQQQTANA